LYYITIKKGAFQEKHESGCQELALNIIIQRVGKACFAVSLSLTNEETKSTIGTQVLLQPAVEKKYEFDLKLVIIFFYTSKLLFIRGNHFYEIVKKRKSHIVQPTE